MSLSGQLRGVQQEFSEHVIYQPLSAFQLFVFQFLLMRYFPSCPLLLYSLFFNVRLVIPTSIRSQKENSAPTEPRTSPRKFLGIWKSILSTGVVLVIYFVTDSERTRDLDLHGQTKLVELCIIHYNSRIVSIGAAEKCCFKVAPLG